MSGGDEDARSSGRRKDGKPFKAGNLREDGSYRNGKYRPPDHGKFKKGDGRPRGKREKGSKNVATIWQKELHQRLTINGDTKTSIEWLVHAVIRRGITRSDRAAETALGEATRLDRANERTVFGREDEVIDAFIAQRIAELGIKISEDIAEDDGLGGSDDEQGGGDAGQ